MSYLSIMADLLMIAAATGAAIYCAILSQRLSRLSSFDKGIGGAIAVLSAQVDEMKAALGAARIGTDGAGQQLQELIAQARDISGELELMIAACHDFAEQAIVVQGGPSAPAPTHLSVVPAQDDALPEVAPQPVFGSRRAMGQPSAMRPQGQP